jgi:hypothetical protein
MKASCLLALIFGVAAAPLAAAPLITTATFQQGAAGYADSFDRKISPTGAADVNGADVDTDVLTNNYLLDGGGSALNDNSARQGLLRFSNIAGGSGVPAGAKVIGATLDAVTSGGTDAQTGGTYNVYRLATGFDASSTWAAPFGGDGLTGDVGEILGSFDDMDVVNSPTSARVDRAVQAWVDGSPNLGFGIRSDQNTNGWSMNTTGAATVANRPKLTVNYTLDPTVEITSYQEDVNSYAGTTDLRFDSGTGSAIDGSTQQQQFLDGFDAATPSPDQSYLLRFDGINLNYQQIYRAELVIKSGFASTNADSPGPFNVHQMLEDWDTSTTYASLDSNSDPAVNGPVELQAGGTIAAAGASVTGINDTEVMYIDVTTIVENWRAGQANYGFYIGTPSPADGGTANGWQIFLTGAADSSFRPELRIIGIVPEPGAATLLLAGGGLAAAVHRRLRRRD